MPVRLSTYHVPDAGIRFSACGVVRVDQSSGQALLIKDPDGEYEVMGCRPATEFREDPPLLRVDLRRIDRGQPSPPAAAPWPPSPRP